MFKASGTSIFFILFQIFGIFDDFSKWSIGPINLLSDRLLRYVLIFEYQILVLDLVVDIRTKISEGI